MADSGNGQTRTIRTEALARVEGEGEMYVRVRGDEVLDVELRIYEPPRLFEALLRGRSFTEAPDITARVCGICPVAYQMSACEAMEDALGVSIPDEIRALRRLIYCGEWLESHSLHLYMLHAPDFLGYESAFAMAREHGEIVERGLRTKKAGNQLIATIGGARSTRSTCEWEASTGRRTAATWSRFATSSRGRARRRRRPCAGPRRCPSPSWSPTTSSWRLRSPAEEYPIDRGRIVSSRGIDIEAAGFDDTFEEEQVPHSNALHCRVRGRGSYLAGPMARFNLNLDRLSPSARQAAEEAGIGSGCRNPFQSIVVRAVEILYACDEAVRLIDAYEPPDPPAIEPQARAAVGHGVTEAPRGLLYHRYELGDEGEIRTARIVPPTSQNQRTIEEDLHEFVQRNLELDDDELTLRCEQTIRNYDPCISCATHFLRLEVDRV